MDTKTVDTVLWTMRLVTVGLVLGLAVLLYQWYDVPLPPEMEEKWKIRVVEAIMRISGYISRCLVFVGVTEPFSSLDRTLADFTVNIITTGLPWRTTTDPALQIYDVFTDKNKIQLRVYEPKSALHKDNRPVLIYFHGGGWSVLSIDSYDALTRKLARDSGIVVISVNYRLSPQYPYPTPHEDCVEAVNYVRQNADKLRINPDRIAIGGDSAGGNLAASLSLRLRDKIKLQLLLVPVLQLFTFNTTSVTENQRYFSSTTNNLGQVVFWLNYLNESYRHAPEMLNNQHTSTEMKGSKFAEFVDQNKWMVRQYIRNETLKQSSLAQKTNFGGDIPKSFADKITDPYIAPLMADEETLIGLPRAYVMSAGYDLIRDDGIMYSERLKLSGVPVHLNNHQTAFHISLSLSDGPFALNVGKQIIQDIVNFLQLHL